MSTLRLDEKNRITISRQVRKISGFRPGDRLVAIPFKGGLILVSVRGKSFVKSLAGFRYEEEKHEATRFLFKGTK